MGHMKRKKQLTVQNMDRDRWGALSTNARHGSYILTEDQNSIAFLRFGRVSNVGQSADEVPFVEAGLKNVVLGRNSRDDTRNRSVYTAVRTQDCVLCCAESDRTT
jgi:hypothetical protein